MDFDFHTFEQQIEAYFQNKQEEFVPRKSKVHVAQPIYNHKEVIRLIKVALSGWITQGSAVLEFEKRFAQDISVRHAISTNSGSSANLLAHLALTNKKLPPEKRIYPGDEIITPAVTWPTTCFPILQIGASPVFVDVEPTTLCIDPQQVREAITDKTKALTLVHLLGHPANLGELIEIAKEHELFLIEDCCEAHGATYKNKKVGSFGDFGTFSFYAGHHITTGEGGMLTTNHKESDTFLRSIRSFGRSCVCPVCIFTDPSATSCPLRDRFRLELDNFDKRFLFTNIGYNLKMTEFQAAFGIGQLEKLDTFIQIRRDNAHYYTKVFEPYSEILSLPSEPKWGTHAWLFYPLIIKDSHSFSRNELLTYLEDRLIETRTILSGNITKQPCFQVVPLKKSSLPVADMIQTNGFYIGCHPGIGSKAREYVTETIIEFLEKKRLLTSRILSSFLPYWDILRLVSTGLHRSFS